ncbi:MAG: type II toxin-antitoxin system Phd/YefM family antitoxin [Gemmatimonadales bacterium]
MRRVSISELKARLSAFLDIVREGGEVLVTDRGRLIARISPVTGVELEESRRELLLRTGQLRAPAAPLPAGFWKRVRPADPEGRSLAVLLEERGEGL